MARVVFTLTTAQVAALLYVEKEGKREWGDYGAADNLVTRGLLKSGKGWNAYTLTAAGRVAVKLIRALQLQKASESAGEKVR